MAQLSAKEAWADDWSVGLHVCIERAGDLLLDSDRLDLLQSIDSCRSISGAARQLGISYRHAWDVVQGINRCCGTPIVVSATGGLKGGGAELTPLGRWAVLVFRRMREHLNQQTVHLLSRLLRVDSSRTLHVAAAVSLEDVLSRLLLSFSLEFPNIRVRAVYGASDELAEQILAGSPIDVFLSADQHQIDRLAAGNVVAANGRFPLVRNGLAAIAPAKSRLPIKKLKDLVQEDIHRIAVAKESCPLGRYSFELLKAHGLLDQLNGRMVIVDHSGAVVSSVRSGQADVGLIYSSDIQRALDCRMLFRVDNLPESIVYSAAIIRRDPQEDSQKLAEFLIRPTLRQAWRACGFLPIRAKKLAQTKRA
jgi:molybdate transport system substrate-binding protein